MSLGQTEGGSSAVAALAPDNASIKAQPRMLIPRIMLPPARTTGSDDRVTIVRNYGGLHLSCPGRDAALFALLRRTGTVPNTGVRYGPGSAAHRSARATRCAASGARANAAPRHARACRSRR